MLFKIIVCIFMFLEFLHNWWLEDKIKEWERILKNET